MKNGNLATRLALIATRAVGLLTVALCPLLPWLLEWYSTVRPLGAATGIAVLAAYYCCVAPVGIALWNLDRLLCRVAEGAVFVTENVRSIRRVQWCCGAVSLICIPAAVAYLPLIFLVVIMGFLSLVVWVLTRVLDTAVALREENDLTI